MDSIHSTTALSGLAPDWSNSENLGSIVTGLKVSKHRFVAVMPFSRLAGLVVDPMSALNPRTRGSTFKLEEYAELHDEMQRQFDAGKKRNAADYAEYICRLSAGGFGDTPTIDFYTTQALPVRDNEPREKAELLWLFDLACVPYDGETQLAARFLAAADRATREQMVILTITHGLPIEHAMQCFHDRNALQRRASPSLALRMNTRDPLLAVVRELEAKIPGLKGTIEWEARQLKPGRVGTASVIRTAISCFAHGISGVQSAKNEDLPEGVDKEILTKRGLLWFSKILPGLLDYMKDRDAYVTSSPAVWAALGALGHPLVELDSKPGDPTLDHVTAGLAAKLVGIRWEKDAHWVGLAVKQTSSGFSFAGGAKDSGSACWKALSDADDANYPRIRGMALMVA